MFTLPDHLPVLASLAQKSSHQELCDKLVALLKENGILVHRADRYDPLASEHNLIKALADPDLLLIDPPGPWNVPQLLFSPAKKTVHRESPENTFLCQAETDLHLCAGRIKRWLEHCRMSTPLTGAVLIGGRSSRMGRPKHLIQDDSGKTWLERSLEAIGPFVDDLVISGGGELPATLHGTARVDDMPGLEGPLAGIGALVRKHPFSSWLVLACDMPNLNEQSIAWLLAQRKGRRRAVIPKNPSTGRSEPLLAWYDYRCGPLIDNMIAAGNRRISELCNEESTAQPWIPDDLVHCWRNFNYPEDLDSRGSSGP